jgi:hypothetical protein
VRAWDYRQRRHARGAWFRLRRVLADASAAFVITADDARQLVAEGHHAEPVGSELEPRKLIVFAPAERVAQVASARAVPVRLDGQVLEAAYLALTPFDTATTDD